LKHYTTFKNIILVNVPSMVFTHKSQKKLFGMIFVFNPHTVSFSGNISVFGTLIPAENVYFIFFESQSNSNPKL